MKRLISAYACGHAGYTTGRKLEAFIRVAEVRKGSVLKLPDKCPECRNSRQ